MSALCYSTAALWRLLQIDIHEAMSLSLEAMSSVVTSLAHQPLVSWRQLGGKLATCNLQGGCGQSASSQGAGSQRFSMWQPSNSAGWHHRCHVLDVLPASSSSRTSLELELVLELWWLMWWMMLLCTDVDSNQGRPPYRWHRHNRGGRRQVPCRMW